MLLCKTYAIYFQGTIFFYCFLETHRRLQIKHIIFSCNPFQRDCFKETRYFVPVYFPWSARLCRFPLTVITFTEYSFLGLKSFIIALFSPLAICNSVVSPPVIRHKSEKSQRGWLVCLFLLRNPSKPVLYCLTVNAKHFFRCNVRRE